MLFKLALTKLLRPGTVVNQALPSLHGESLEFTLIVPLKNYFKWMRG